HLPRPAQGRRLATEQICKPELLAMPRVAKNGESWARRPSLPAPGRGKGAAKAGASAAIRVAARRPELCRSPKLALAPGLVAVVLEGGDAAAHPLEHVEASPQERPPHPAPPAHPLGNPEV